MKPFLGTVPELVDNLTAETAIIAKTITVLIVLTINAKSNYIQKNEHTLFTKL